MTTETTLPPMLQPDTEKALRTAGRKVAEWTTERDRLVKQAVAEGGSLREVGTAAGISHTAVKFIAHGRPSP
jgi:DNA-binding NarL/FixJ family response regulator